MDFGKKRLGNWVITKYNKIIKCKDNKILEEILLKECKDSIPYIRIAPVSGDFSFEYSGLDPMFVQIEQAMDNEKSREALMEVFAINAELLHNETGVFHFIYMKSMDLFYQIASHRNAGKEQVVVDVVQKAFECVKNKIDELYDGAIDYTEVTEADTESLNEMKVESEMAEELKKDNDNID